MPAPSHSSHTQTLINHQSGDIWRYVLSESEAVIEAGKLEKPRKRSKKFSSTDEALDYFTKEEWKKLKTGFVLHNPNAQTGEPTLRVYVGGGNTGQLPLASSSEGLLITRFGDSADTVLQLNVSGQSEMLLELPQNQLVLSMCFAEEQGRLLLNADHQIFSWNPESPKRLGSITSGNKNPASCLGVGGDHIVVFAPPHLLVQAGRTGATVMQVECEPQVYGGHTPQLCAALNREGSILAVCSQPGELSLLRVPDGTKLGDIQADFAMIEKLEFDLSGNLLIGLANYGPWGPLFFDVDSLMRMDPPVELPTLVEGTVDFAMHPKRNWLALASKDRAYVFDLDRSKPIAQIKLQHLARRVGIHFFDDQLAVRTDLGCVDLYRVT